MLAEGIVSRYVSLARKTDAAMPPTAVPVAAYRSLNFPVGGTDPLLWYRAHENGFACLAPRASGLQDRCIAVGIPKTDKGGPGQ